MGAIFLFSYMTMDGTYTVHDDKSENDAFRKTPMFGQVQHQMLCFKCEFY